MPTRLRVISFSNVEVVEALIDYCANLKRPLPGAPINRLSFSTDAAAKFILKVDETTPLISFYEHEVAVALILLCKKKSIPLPRRATKSLQVTQASVSLHLAIRPYSHNNEP
jgi:hypothetical protein